jgi:hypothetical protein
MEDKAVPADTEPLFEANCMVSDALMLSQKLLRMKHARCQGKMCNPDIRRLLKSMVFSLESIWGTVLWPFVGSNIEDGSSVSCISLDFVV